MRQAPARVRREPVVMDTGARRVTSRGIWSRVVPEGRTVAIYLRLGPLGWIRFNHWAEALWAARELIKAVKQVCPYGDYKPTTEQLQTLADEIGRMVREAASGSAPPVRCEDVARWVQRLQQLANVVGRLEEQVP